MNPTAGDVHVNRPLTNISIAYMQQAAGFVATRVFPTVPVQKQSDAYFKYDRTDFMRDGMKKRAPATETAGGGWKTTTDTYYAHVWGVHKDIDDQLRANTDDPLNMDRDASIWVSMQGLIRREKAWASAFFTTGVWTGAAVDVTGVSASPAGNTILQWNDANSNPISDIKTYASAIQLRTGFRPNKLVIGRQALDVLSEHPDVIDRIKYTSGNDRPAVVTKAALAALFEVDEVLVMDGVENTAAESGTFEGNLSTANQAFIGGKKALLVYANPNPSIMMPSGGYTFVWNGYTGADNDWGARIKRFRMEQLSSDRVELEMAFDPKVVSPDCGVFFNSVIA